jgi:hypothetical protein
MPRTFPPFVVMACDDDVVPLQERIESVADDADLEEVNDESVVGVGQRHFPNFSPDLAAAQD